MNFFQYIFFLERFEKRKREVEPQLIRTNEYFHFGGRDVTFHYDFNFHILTMSGNQTDKENKKHHLDLILKSLKDVKKIKNVEINCLIRFFINEKESFHSYGPNAKIVESMMKKLPFRFTKRGFIPSTYDISDLYHIDTLTQEGKINLCYDLMGTDKVLLQTFSTIDDVETWIKDKDFKTHKKQFIQTILSNLDDTKLKHMDLDCDITEGVEKDTFVYSFRTKIKINSIPLYSHSFWLQDPNGLGFRQTLIQSKDEVQEKINKIHIHLLLLEEFTKLSLKHDSKFVFKRAKLVEFNLFNHPYILQIFPHSIQDKPFVLIRLESRFTKELKEFQIEETNVIDMKNIFIKQIETWIKSRKLISLMN